MATDQEKQDFLTKYGIHVEPDGSFSSDTLGIKIPKPDPRADKFSYIQGRINSVERAKNTFDSNAPKPGILDQIQALGGKAMNAVSPYLPTMKDVPAIAGATAGGAAFGPPGAVAGGLGGEGLRQIFSQLGSGTPTPPAEAAGDYAKAAIPSAAEGMGTQLMAKLGMTKAMQGAAGGAEHWIEQRLLGTGQAAEKRALTAKLAPEMAQDPAFTRAFSNKQFDDAIVNRMGTAKNLLNTAEAAIPANQTADKGPLLAKIDQIMDDFRIPGQSVQKQVPVNTPGRGVTGFQAQNIPQNVSVNKDALSALQELKDEIDKFPDQIPWKDLQEFRQKLDKNIFLKGGFKETATAADRAKIVAEREVANATRGHLADSLPAGPVKQNMEAANAAYSKAADMGLASGMDFDMGRRISDVGAKTALQKILPNLIKGGVGGGLGGGAVYEYLNHK